MKRSRITFSTVILVVISIGLWVMMHEPETKQPTPVTINDRPDQAKLEEVEAKAEAVEAAEAKGDEGVLEKAKQELAAAVGGRAGRMLQMAMDRNAPITMYGKVVDQHGRPVAGADVNLDIAGGGTLAPGTGLVTYTTDSAGIFQVEAKGQEVAILGVEHPRLANLIFETGDRTTSLDAVGKYGKKSSWRTYTTLDNPYVIKVWRVEEFEDVEKGGTAFIPQPNGKPDKRAGIVVTCRRDPIEPNKHWRNQKGSWSITFRPIDGGIQEADDLYLNEAPNSGYEPELTVSMERGDPNYRVRIHPRRSYYYTAHNGQWYGSFSASFEPYILEDKCLVNADIKYNPHGSRNLAVKPRY